MNIDKIQWLEQRNPLLSSFVNHTTAYDISNRNEKKVNAIVHSIEQIYYTRNIKLAVGNHQGVTLTVHNYICSPSEQVECPIGHVQCAIDNNQKLGKSSGRIMVGSKMPVDICISISNFQISESTIQKDETLMPCEWLTNDFSELVDQVNAYELKYLDTFRSYRNNIITEYLAETKIDQKVDICGAQYDKIDIASKQNQMGFKNSVCTKCNFMYPSKDDKCAECKHDHKFYPLDFDPYRRTPSKHPPKPPVVTVGEPCMVNPCNEKNIRIVLDHIRNTCNIPEERKWVVVWSDGIPYLFAMRLQQHLYACSSCDNIVDTRTETPQDHVKKQNHPIDSVLKKYFGDFVFRPGPGHIELNMAKTLLHFSWPVLSSIVQLLGFRTKKAQDVVKRGANHHRSKQILFTFFDSVLKELLVLFIRNAPQNISASSFHEWVRDSVKSPSVLYLYDLCTTFLLSFKMYNGVVRKNHHKI
ncbi:unnamed protein product [Mytilus coruscus]|uniref:Uncharacterized protein n=1 Tax=Mytilus coruscus TaxID=42192 RepID=A0A6J8EBF7_MYTCO|nr:unnamed protein product [Mytilus coruscus]